MLRVGIQYKSPSAVRAIHNLKVSTKKQILKLEDIISKPTLELKAKKTYMQTDEFWKDEHNAKMVTLYDKMIKARDEITKNISINNAKPNTETQVQGINGIARIKKYLKKNPKLNFWSELTFYDKAHNEYKFAQMQIYNHARSFKNKIGR